MLTHFWVWPSEMHNPCATNAVNKIQANLSLKQKHIKYMLNFSQSEDSVSASTLLFNHGQLLPAALINFSFCHWLLSNEQRFDCVLQPLFIMMTPPVRAQAHTFNQKRSGRQVRERSISVFMSADSVHQDERKYFNECIICCSEVSRLKVSCVITGKQRNEFISGRKYKCT